MDCVTLLSSKNHLSSNCKQELAEDLLVHVESKQKLQGSCQITLPVSEWWFARLSEGTYCICELLQAWQHHKMMRA